MLDNIFTIDDSNNTIFYKWGGVGKPHIVNDKVKQEKLIKLIDKRDAFLRPMISISIDSFIWFLILGPIVLFLTPLVITSTIIGLPVFFSIKYLSQNLTNIEILCITIVIDLIIFIYIYSHKVNQILKTVDN